MFEQQKAMQKEHYEKRIGKVYGDYEVIDVQYDWELRKQLWTMKCVLCGSIKQTYNGYEYSKGKNSGVCKCRGKRAKAEKIAQKQKRLLDLPSDPKWVGKVFGEWEVLKYRSGRGWSVKCVNCGRETYHPVKAIKELRAPKCLCKFNYGKYNDKKWIGNKYGNLTILNYSDKHFNCVCDCGEKSAVRPTHLFNGKTKTCARPDCEFRFRILSEGSTTHGQSKTRLYKVWRGMIDRCTNQNIDSYSDYGGRGIKICDEWKEFMPFYEWATKNGFEENKPGVECSIDRINNDGNYEPSNCRWTNMKEQRYNQRPHKQHNRKNIWTINGETKSAIDWCAEHGLSVPMVMYRIKTKGMSPEEALTSPKLTDGRPTK